MDYDFVAACYEDVKEEADFKVKLGDISMFMGIRLEIEIVFDGREETCKDHPDPLTREDYNLISTVYVRSRLPELIYYSIRANEKGMIWLINRIIDQINLKADDGIESYYHTLKLLMQLVSKADLYNKLDEVKI